MNKHFVSKKKLAADTFAVTDRAFIKYYLMHGVLARATQAEEARAKSGGKSANGRYVPFTGTVEISFRQSVGSMVLKKYSRYMSGKLNEPKPIEQVREVHIAPGGDTFQYSFFVELKDEGGREVSTMISTKAVVGVVNPSDRKQVDVDVLDAVAADIFSFLYSQRPEDAVLKSLKLQAA